MSDADIQRQLKRSTGTVCGRIASHQVNRPLAKANLIYSFSLPKTLLGVSLLLGGTYTESRGKVIDLPINQHTTQEINQLEARSHQPAETDLSDTLRVVRGRVIDAEDKTDIPGVNVIIKGTMFGTNSNEKGEFALQIPAELDTESTSLSLQFIGFQTMEIALGRFKTNATFALNPSAVYMGEVVVCTVCKPTVWQRIKGAFRGK